MVGVCLIEQSMQALVYLLLSILKLALPGFEMLNALGDELVKSYLIIVLLEGILEEPKDIFIDVDGEVGC